MKTPIEILEERIAAAMAAVTGRQGCSAIVRASSEAKFGDYQANGVMALAKEMKTNPRKLAEEVVEKTKLDDICERPEVAGPGFINLRLKGDFIAARLLKINADAERLGIDKTAEPQTVVVDFSGPNIAKQMHVGHLRSTIIGDCLCRMLEFLGHKVIRQNHIGDWGTSLGKVILGSWHKCMARKHVGAPYYLHDIAELKRYKDNKENLQIICSGIRNRHEKDWQEDFVDIKGDAKKFFDPFLEKIVKNPPPTLWDEITTLYQYVNLIETSVAGMELTVSTRRSVGNSFEYFQIEYEYLSRHITTMLQKIDKCENKQEKDAWNLITKISLEHCQSLYDRLNVTLTKDDVRGESFYKDKLEKVVSDLQERGYAEESDGAVCVFPEGFRNKEGERLPLIIQKSDGAYLYATTDLAAIRYRVNELKADKIVYVTDARQKLHFEMLFATARMAKWVNDDIELSHITFGSVLGENGKPLKTRSGENVKLKEVLDEAVERARAVVEEKNPELDEDKKAEIARAVGIGAVKYADYSNNRTSDYVFSFDKMLAMDGNTAPYMQYAYARIKSIERKAQTRDVDIRSELAGLDSLNLTEPAELDLAKYLLRYGESIGSASADYRPNYLTGYLYELAQKFSAFYTDCLVLRAAAEKRPTRLLLCDLTARTIKHGLSELLGINVVEQM